MKLPTHIKEPSKLAQDFTGTIGEPYNGIPTMDEADLEKVEYTIDYVSTIVQAIKSTFESPRQSIEEIFDNSMDAQASFIIFIADKRTNIIDVTDNGIGIWPPENVWKFGGSKKREYKQKHPELGIHGEFGEGVKTCLSMCSELIYRSSNEHGDTYIILRVPTEDYRKAVSYQKYPKAQIRSDIGCELTLRNVDVEKLEEICSQKEIDNMSWKYGPRLAKRMIQIQINIIEKNGSKVQSFMKPHEKISKLFELPEHNIKVGDTWAKFIGVESKDRRLLICVDWIVIKEIQPEENVFGVVNFDKLNFTRNRKAIVSNDISRIFFDVLKAYLNTHFKKAGRFDSLKDSDVEMVNKLMTKLKELGVDFLPQSNMIPPISYSGGIADSTVENKTEFIRARKDDPRALQVSPEILHVRKRKKGKKREKGKERERPKPSNKEEGVLVKKIKNRNLVYAVKVHVEGNGRKKYDDPGIGLGDTDIQEDTRAIIPEPPIEFNGNKATLSMNKATEAVQRVSKMPLSDQLKNLIPELGQAFQTLRYIMKGITNIDPIVFTRDVGETTDALYKVIK